MFPARGAVFARSIPFLPDIPILLSLQIQWLNQFETPVALGIFEEHLLVASSSRWTCTFLWSGEALPGEGCEYTPQALITKKKELGLVAFVQAIIISGESIWHANTENDVDVNGNITSNAAIVPCVASTVHNAAVSTSNVSSAPLLALVSPT